MVLVGEVNTGRLPGILRCRMWGSLRLPAAFPRRLVPRSQALVQFGPGQLLAVTLAVQLLDRDGADNVGSRSVAPVQSGGHDNQKQ